MSDVLVHGVSVVSWSCLLGGRYRHGSISFLRGSMMFGILTGKKVVQAEVCFSCNENSSMRFPFPVSAYNIIPKLWREYFSWAYLITQPGLSPQNDIGLGGFNHDLYRSLRLFLTRWKFATRILRFCWVFARWCLGCFVGEQRNDDPMGSSMLVSERLLLLASLDTVGDNTEKVLLSAESIKSNEMVEWFREWQTIQYQDTDLLARNEYSLESIPVYDAWYQWFHSSHAMALCPQSHDLSHMGHEKLEVIGHGFVSIPPMTNNIASKSGILQTAFGWNFLCCDEFLCQ